MTRKTYVASNRPRDYTLGESVTPYRDGTALSELVAAAYELHDELERQFTAAGIIKQLARWALCHSCDCGLAASVSPHSEREAILATVRRLCGTLRDRRCFVAVLTLEALMGWCEQHVCRGPGVKPGGVSVFVQCKRKDCGELVERKPRRGRPDELCEKHKRR